MQAHAGMAMTRRAFMALCVALCSGLGIAATAAISQHIRNEIPHAQLSGSGSFTWFGLKIYEASLWTGEGGYQPQALSNAKFALDLQYARDLNGSRIADASLQQIVKLAIGTPAQQQAWHARMKEIFPDVQDGTHITGIYLPGQGARFYLNGALLGEVLDADFAHAFFAIWLDPRTSAPRLRDALLTGAGKR